MTIDCRDVERMLSVYYDGELESSSAVPVHQHLSHCPACREALHKLEALSQLVSEEDRLLVPPPQLAWNRFSQQLPGNGPSDSPRHRRRREAGRPIIGGLPLPRLPLAIAASFLLLVGSVAWWALSGGDGALAETGLQSYVRRFVQDPDAAQVQLLAQYRGEPIPTTSVAQRLGLPITTDPPAEAPFQLASLHKLRMPCCDCVQAVCVRPDGTKIAVFSHQCSTQVRLGDGKSQQLHCDGKTCRLTELSHSQLAVQWKAGTTQLLVVGARDRNEVAQLVAWLNTES